MTDKKIPVTQEEIRDLLNKILVACQRSRSIIMESMEGDGIEPERGLVESHVASYIHPYLFPHDSKGINLIEAISRTMDKNRIIEPINLYNILFMVEKEVAVYASFPTYWPGTYLPEAHEYMTEISRIMREKSNKEVLDEKPDAL